LVAGSIIDVPLDRTIEALVALRTSGLSAKKIGPNGVSRGAEHALLLTALMAGDGVDRACGRRRRACIPGWDLRSISPATENLPDNSLDVLLIGEREDIVGANWRDRQSNENASEIGISSKRTVYRNTSTSRVAVRSLTVSWPVD
jgi:hypothetical protein